MRRFENLGRALRGLRRERRLRQSDLAATSGVPVSSLSSYEQGRRLPNLENLERLVDALGLSLGDLDDALQRYGPPPGR
jgi:transcriptional regulator with XRE-family HTH domain